MEGNIWLLERWEGEDTYFTVAAFDEEGKRKYEEKNKKFFKKPYSVYYWTEVGPLNTYT